MEIESKGAWETSSFGGGWVISATTVETVILLPLLLSLLLLGEEAAAEERIRAAAAERGFGFKSARTMVCLDWARNGRDNATEGKYPVATPMSRCLREKFSAKKGSRTMSVLLRGKIN